MTAWFDMRSAPSAARGSDLALAPAQFAVSAILHCGCGCAGTAAGSAWPRDKPASALLRIQRPDSRSYPSAAGVAGRLPASKLVITGGLARLLMILITRSFGEALV